MLGADCGYSCMIRLLMLLETVNDMEALVAVAG